MGLGFCKLEELLGSLLVHHSPEVKTEAPIQPEEQASASMTARPYSTQDESGTFLHIDVKTLSTEVGSNLQLNLNTNLRDSSVNNKITRFTILVRGWTCTEEFFLWYNPGKLSWWEPCGMDSDLGVG